MMYCTVDLLYMSYNVIFHVISPFVINPLRPINDQRQTSAIKLSAVMGSAVWRNWRVISCWDKSVLN